MLARFEGDDFAEYLEPRICNHCVNARLSDCERDRLDAKVVQLPLKGKVA